ncbi:hypothetical protein PAAG_07747 [Paracoccidioides lutzii Pb01]|uniref:Uncharacterized protein n=1 Tax=Paracoccidioides lutzii (strain ATCC MYA-826 / Pb01) TaxID=502779 RepID=C1HA18_PARBA|nr:hypothetical protein PAAG_07747 [Paracoccidioides lutzii Pb01]EEH37190.2 hypothetical protein PAAG_07747 [Paracoccidioides lutzii Pb01]
MSKVPPPPFLYIPSVLGLLSSYLGSEPDNIRRPQKAEQRLGSKTDLGIVRFSFSQRSGEAELGVSFAHNRIATVRMNQFKNKISINAREFTPCTRVAALLVGLDDVPGEMQLPMAPLFQSVQVNCFYSVVFRSVRVLRTPTTELGVSRAFDTGDIQVEGEILLIWDYIRTATALNSNAVVEHYYRGGDFISQSQGLFKQPDESIEKASEHKLETMFSSLELKSGTRLLEFDGEWGGVTQFCGARGVHVITLNPLRRVQLAISSISLTTMICPVRFCYKIFSTTVLKNHMTLRMYGVVEHLPDYRRVARIV